MTSLFPATKNSLLNIFLQNGLNEEVAENFSLIRAAHINQEVFGYLKNAMCIFEGL